VKTPSRNLAGNPRPLLIAGRPINGAHLALRRLSHAKKTGQALVVVDYQGIVATNLSNSNKGNIHKSPMLMCDMANRRRATALFRFTQSPGMKPALRGFLERLARHMVVPISSATTEMVVDLAYRMAEQGTIGLVAIVNSLRRPELTHWLRRDQATAAELNQLLELLTWALRFPSVWSTSEGNNAPNLDRHLTMGGTIWIELQASHFERIEHLIVSWMVDAALTDVLLSMKPDKANGDAKDSPLVLYGYPAVCPQPFTSDLTSVKHVGLFSLSSEQPLPAPAKTWLTANADLWIAGDIGELPAGSKTPWLTEAERIRLKSLKSEEVWVRNGADLKAVTTLARLAEPELPLAECIRIDAFQRLRATPVKQFSSAVLDQNVQLPLHADLYPKLCTREALYAGWLRVKTHNRHSYGFDQVTIEQFGTTVDLEIDQLLAELKEGRYHCRPLRTARIPKADGGVRVLKVASVRDRVVQAACLALIEPLFETLFSSASFAYRPGRGAHHALAMARSVIQSGKHWVVIADIAKCFDTVDHEILMRLVGDVIGDREVLNLIRHWLVTDVIDFLDVTPSEMGVAQGEAISPLLANIYLNTLDKEFERNGITFVRYADDYVVLCDTEVGAQGALRLMTVFLQGVLRMSLKPAKTHYCHVDQGIGFLGFHIGMADVCIPQVRLTLTKQKVENLVDTIGSASTPVTEKHAALLKLNALTRGFRNYFMVDSAPSIRAQLIALDAELDEFAAQRIGSPDGMATAWLAREKFAPEVPDVSRQQRTAAEVAVLTGAYPVDRLRYPVPLDQTETTASKPEQPVSPESVFLRTAGNQQTELDVLSVDGRLHVMKSGCYVTVSADDVVIKKRKAEVYRVPIADLTMVYLEGRGIAFSADLTIRLCESDVPVVFTPLIGPPAAIAQPVQSLRANVRLQQALRRNDPDIVRMGGDMLSAKVGNSASVLKYYARSRKGRDTAVYSALTIAADEIRVISESLDGFDPTAAGARATAMGHEGRAAAKYWSACSHLIPAEMEFPGRHTRHAVDCVNSAINYVYGMLYGEVWRAVIRAGLDPFFGVMHGAQRDQGSLVFDLIEEYRAPFGDRVVLGLLGRGFELVLDKDGRIKSSCRQKLVQAFHKLWKKEVRWRGKLRTPAEILDLQATSLKNTFLGKGEYLPFRFRW
jgi:group II intron reverse transcriptase/maturase/CRISPR-associated endonuclease Cas1